MSTLPSLSFLLGIVVLFYGLSFVVFAIVRVLTGLSIQRIGYSGLRRIAYTPRDGMKLEIRGLGLQLHRPTFAQPTWISIAITELKVTLDLDVLGSKDGLDLIGEDVFSNEKAGNGILKDANFKSSSFPGADDTNSQRSETWKKLTAVKEKIKHIHRYLHWIRLIDVLAIKSSCVVVGIGTINVGAFQISVDTRPSTTDRSRIFQHTKNRSRDARPAEWKFICRSVLFTPDGKESMEILDLSTANIHGKLHPQLEGLRDASISFKLGRVNIPWDDFVRSSHLVRRSTLPLLERRRPSTLSDLSSVGEKSDDDTAAAEEDELLAAIADGKEFISSILRGIHEIAISIGFIGFTKRIDFIHRGDTPIYFNMALKEFGAELYRLDPSTPAHSMYFSRSDIAHEALVSAISMSLGIDDGQGRPERLLYVPMATTTIKTTLPAKALQLSKNKNTTERNTNVLFSNFVITSPSLDMDPKHLQLVLSILENRPVSRRGIQHGGHHFVSQILPKTSIKLSIHEPVVRIALPPVKKSNPEDFDFDLLISSVSNIALDIDSFHSENAELHYSLTSSFRVTSHRLYYQTASREQHTLLITDAIEFKTQVGAMPGVAVTASVNFSTLSLFMIRPEISEGVRQILRQIHSEVQPDKLRHSKTAHDPNFMRRLPAWLRHFEIQGSDVNLEIAALDSKVSSLSRGFALHLDSWTADYKAEKDVAVVEYVRRRGTSRSLKPEDMHLRPASPSPKRSKHINPTDGRRLAVHIRSFEAFVIESAHSWEQEPFISIPRSEVAFTTSNDQQGPVFHINSHTRAAYMHYSLFRHYALGVAITMLKQTFVESRSTRKEMPQASTNDTTQATDHVDHSQSSRSKELVTIDVKANFIQLKAQMPEEPNIMFHVLGLDIGRHRWTTPHLKCDLVRFYADTPDVKGTWSRLVSIKSPRVDVREVRKFGANSPVERNIDLVADAIRIGVPHQLVVHGVIDNIVSTGKTVAQLHHRFKTNSDEYILAKHPEGPKMLPKVSLRTHVLAFEIEDGAFEFKIGAIFRAGVVEQKQRLAREEAFRIKSEKIEQLRSSRASSRLRDNATFQKSHARNASTGSHDDGRRRSRGRKRSPSASDVGGRNMRYDKEGGCNFSQTMNTTIKDAWEKLQRLNEESWKRRINMALSNQSESLHEIHSLMWGIDEISGEWPHGEKILSIPTRPALMSTLISDVHLTIDKPNFPMADLPDFLHRVGKGLPRDTQFALLVPLFVQIDMGEARVQLRDYPLPLLHIPSIRPGQSPRLPSWSIKTNFVIAEEFRDYQSTRDLAIIVVAPDKMDPEDKSKAFAVDVRRTVSPVKTYSDIQVDINTAYDTKFTWGSSYQPAIQDMMQVIEGFTKPQIDPSEKVGFWDKIRLNFHSRINIAWKGDGDVHLMLRGSRDPYTVTGQGTGFAMVWRGDVRLNVWQHDDPTKFMIVDSAQFVLAVPDYNHYARKIKPLSLSDGGSSSISSEKDGMHFKKVIMKLSGKIRWVAGIVFERNLENGNRSFTFEPHYNVTIKNPVHVKEIKTQKHYDAFRGFRSNFIHLSISLMAPSDRDWSVVSLEPSSTNYNSIHLTPRFFTHFWSWWSLFSGAMSLPIRQGSLWPGVDKSNKKFGRHLATIKYSILLSPLFISHIYKHKDAEDYEQDVVSATGLKMRLNTFVLDLHQRREEFRAEVKGSNKVVTTTAIKTNQALVDLAGADIRAVSSEITGTNAEDLVKATNERLAGFQTSPHTIDLSKFTIPDNDFGWIDVDDFVEIDWTLPTDSDPDTKILPLAYAPRFTYLRQTDHNNTIAGDANRHSPFGNEPTHSCVIASQADARKVQIQLIEERLKRVEELILEHGRTVGQQELLLIRAATDHEPHRKRLQELNDHTSVLERKRDFLKMMLKDLHARLEQSNKGAAAKPEKVWSKSPEEVQDEDALPKEEQLNRTYKEPDDSNNTADHVTDFSNRFVVHNSQIKWNNSLRNIILRYIHQNSQRRGFVYYTSRRAVKFILDIVEEQNKAKNAASETKAAAVESVITPGLDDELSLQDRIQQLLDDGKKFVDADDPESADGNRKGRNAADNHEVADEYVAKNTYHVRLVAPQIQLQSEKNTKAAVLLTARGMRLKIVQIMDKDRVSDDVSGLVQRRFTVEMDNLQFFVTNRQNFSSEYLHMYSGIHYGTLAGSSWPPWVPIEVMFDFTGKTYGFSRVVQRTSATLRYDKYNTLRLKYNDDVSMGTGEQDEDDNNAESRVDHLWLDFPTVRAICDSAQYYAMYVIVLDLLIWSEPLEKIRSERLEKIMLASDFSDLRGAPELIILLQNRIRQLNEIKTHFHVNEKYLDRRGWEDRISMEEDLAACEDELFFMMKAITTSQRKPDERSPQTSSMLKWDISATEVVWHLTREFDLPLAEFQLKNATYERIDNNDGSNRHTMEIDGIQGLNLLPNAIYPEIIGPYMEGFQGDQEDVKMFRVEWYMLEAIAGIPVVDRFEVAMFPLKIQLEREAGKRLFEYIFPGMGSNDEGFSPMMIKHSLPSQDDSEAEDLAIARARQVSAAKASFNKDSKFSPSVTSLESRLQPTLKLRDHGGTMMPPKTKTGLGISLGESHRLKMFNQTNNQKRNSGTNPAPKNTSSDNLTLGDSPRRASTEVEKKKRFGLQRSTSHESSASKRKKSDDLTQMLNRASNYMTLAYVKIPSVVLCLSYKGKGHRNFEDVHNLVFRMPTLEYRNKTWSNLDLALALKKDVIRALISHTGAIIGNKLTHHKPSKYQQSRLRELANSSAMLSSSADLSRRPSDTSLQSRSMVDDESPPRFSDLTEDDSILRRTDSFASSLSGLRDFNGTHAGMPSFNEVSSNADKETTPQKDPLSRTLTRHFSELTQRARGRDSTVSHTSTNNTEDAEDGKRGSVRLLGKKLLSALPHTTSSP